MHIYADASTLIALGTVGELDRLGVFDGHLVIPERVRTEVTTQPAAENLRRFIEELEDTRDSTPEAIAATTRGRAKAVLDEPEPNGDTEIIAGVLAKTDRDEPVAVVSDDKRVRTVADGLGATVTGTIGVVVRNVAEGELTADEAKALVRRLDDHGLHMTGELRETADDLIDEAS
ncbi:hypothetical protein [Natronomonas gomsonensis]|uniref:hypothetical protein n=1 Tax=Natronomonas gomsonensis TaxID=1046043 RepID=UPI0015BE4709|nr:hypothetical protein [Natronomonas gomsonensis]